MSVTYVSLFITHVSPVTSSLDFLVDVFLDVFLVLAFAPAAPLRFLAAGRLLAGVVATSSSLSISGASSSASAFLARVRVDVVLAVTFRLSAHGDLIAALLVSDASKTLVKSRGV